MNETFRPRGNFAWAGVSFVLILLYSVNSILLVSNFQQNVLELGAAILMTGISYLIWIKPKLVLHEEMIEVVNPLRTEFIRYADVLELDTKWSLSIQHSKGTTKVWVAPAGGKQRWIADKKFGWLGGNITSADTRNNGMESMSASLHSASGQAAYMIQERIKRIH